MNEFINNIGMIITNILTALYQPFWYALLSAILLCFLYLYAYHPVNMGKGLKAAIIGWIEEFKVSIFFRKLFVLFFLIVMILFITLLNRDLWMNPLSDVMGGWWIWKEINGEIQLTTECFENVIMMIPFMFLLLWTFGEKIAKGFKAIVLKSIKYTFCFTLTIEFLQLFLRLGTFQISDIFYNTLGGLIGGILYWIYTRIRYRHIQK